VSIPTKTVTNLNQIAWTLFQFRRSQFVKLPRAAHAKGHERRFRMPSTPSGFLQTADARVNFSLLVLCEPKLKDEQRAAKPSPLSG
jgi:hypothetical protein